MMMDLYDQDRIMEIHIASERKIAGCKAVSVQRVREIETGMLQEHKEKMKKIGKMLA